MNTDQLDLILSQTLRHTRTSFIGVFASDRIPSLSTLSAYPCCFVVNLDPHDAPGSHWVAYYLESTRHVEFFDSYGNPPSLYLLEFATPIAFNEHEFQSLDSNVCGHYCIYYLTLRATQHTLSSICKKLDECGHSSDHCVRDYVNRLIASHFLTVPIQCTGQSCKQRSHTHK